VKSIAKNGPIDLRNEYLTQRQFCNANNSKKKLKNDEGKI